MPGVTKTGEAVYLYDGTFRGFLCCVYNLYYNNIKPCGIETFDSFSPSLRRNLEIPTDLGRAKKVRAALEKKIYRGCAGFLEKGLLSTLKEREMVMCRYVEKGFRIGKGIKNFLTDEDVNALFRAVRSLEEERHHYLGIVRFYKAGDVYLSKINPKGSILSLIGGHFSQRFRDMDFMIYDENHGLALIHRGGRYAVIPARKISMPTPSEEEKMLMGLWKGFYEAVAIKERENPKLRMSYLPKYQWKNLPELNGNFLSGAEKAEPGPLPPAGMIRQG